MSNQFMDIPGSKIHYEVQGHGYPVVLIHAGIANMGMWDDQVDAFTGKYRLIRYDIRGWGRSVDQNGDYSDHGDLHSLLSNLDVEKAVLVGASFGGSIAINLALAHPEMVSALVLVGPGLDGYEFTSEGYKTEEEALHDAYKQGDKALAAEYAARIWIDGQGRSTDDVAAPVRIKALEMIRHTFELPDGAGIRHELEPKAIARLDEIDKPVLIVLGEYDQPDITNISRLIHESITNAKLVIIKDAAHLPNMEKPAEFNRVVLDFLGYLRNSL